MRARPNAGFSLAELLVGCALGLALIAASLQLFAKQVQAQREQLVEARLHQDLRAASDLIVRAVRRAGHHGMDDAAANPHRAISTTASSLATSHTRDAIDNGMLDDREHAGFRLAEGSLQAMVGGRWQAMTDPGVVRIARFEVAMAAQPAPTAGLCQALITREVAVVVEGHPAADPHRLRRMRTLAAVRNDDVDVSACSARLPGTGTRSRS